MRDASRGRHSDMWKIRRTMRAMAETSSTNQIRVACAIRGIQLIHRAVCDGISRVCCGQTLAGIQPSVIDEFMTDRFPSVVRVRCDMLCL